MNVYLIGMPGSGKSTVGKKLASKIGYEFIDMDEYIEIKAGMFIDEIFQNYGEEYFRALEKNTLEELAKKDRTVISTGGGIIKDKGNKDLFNGICIYLNTPITELSKRVEKSNVVRPLLQKYSLAELYDERKNLYNYFKDYEVLDMNLDKSISDIITILEDLKWEY